MGNSQMARSVLVLGVAHELQGSKFQGYVDDPSFGLLLKSSMNGVDFVFEETAGLGPSKAEDLANSILGTGHYVDIDPSQGPVTLAPQLRRHPL